MPIETAYPSNPTGAVTLGQSGAAVSHTGDTTETVLATIPVPANLLGKNGRLAIEATFTRNGSGTAVVASHIRFGLSGAGAGGTNFGSANFATTNASLPGLVRIANANATNVQAGGWTAGAAFANPFSANASALASGAIDTTQACEIAITGQCTNSGDTITLVSYQVLAYPHA